MTSIALTLRLGPGGQLAKPAFSYTLASGARFSYLEILAAVCKVQRRFRAWAVRAAYVDVRAAVVLVQSGARGCLARARGRSPGAR